MALVNINNTTNVACRKLKLEGQITNIYNIQVESVEVDVSRNECVPGVKN